MQSSSGSQRYLNKLLKPISDHSICGPGLPYLRAKVNNKLTEELI